MKEELSMFNPIVSIYLSKSIQVLNFVIRPLFLFTCHVITKHKRSDVIVCHLLFCRQVLKQLVKLLFEMLLYYGLP